LTRPRRRSPLRGLVITVLVLAILLVVADRVALVIADRAVASKIQSTQNLSRRPGVHIEGFPFLTQVIGNRYRAVRLNASQVTVGDSGRKVTMKTVNARATGINTTRDFSRATADTVSGTATVTYSELSRVVGVPLRYDGTGADGAGRVATTKTLSALGLSVTGSVSAEVNVLGGDRLQFSQVRVTLADTGVSLPQSTTDQFLSVFGNQLSLSGLPFGLRIDRIIATPAGVEVAGSGTHVPLNGN